MTTTLTKLVCLAVLALACTAADPVLPPPLPATTAAVNTTSVSGTVLAGGKPLVGAVVWLRVPDGQGGFTADRYSYPITAQHGYTFSLTAGTWQLHVVPPAGYAVVGDNPLTITTAAGLPATVNFAASVAVAPTAVPVVPTTAPAAPLGGIVCGCGSAAAATPVYHAGQAPCAAWFDARPLGSTRADRRTWNFGDTADPRPDPKHLLDPANYPTATVDGNTLSLAECACHIYRQPGTYTVTLVDARPTGAVDRYAVTVVVDPDARRQVYFAAGGSDANAGTAAAPWLSGAKFAAAAATSNTHVHVAAGTPDLALTGCVRMPINTVVEFTPDATGTPANLVVGNLAAFDGWPGQTSGFLLIGARITAPTTPGGKNGYAYAVPPSGSKAVSVRGDNVVMLDCRLGYLAFGMRGEDGDGAAMIGCTQDDPLGISKAAFSQFSGTGRMFARLDNLTGSTDESITRTDGSGGCGWTFVDNYARCTYPLVVGKAVQTLRNANRAVIANNAFGGSQVGLSSTDGEGTVLDADVLVTANLFRSANVNVNPRVDGVDVVGNDIDSRPQVTLTSSAALGTLQNVNVVGNTTPGTLWQVKVTGTVPGLVADAGRVNVGSLPPAAPVAAH